MKSILYSQVQGRRKGDTEVKWKFDWWKLILGILLGSLIGWGSWVTRMCQKAEKTEEIVDMQVGVMHGRITKVDDRINSIVWKFFEQELADCTEDVNDKTILE